MTDTTPEMQKLYEEMLLSCSGEERLRMAGSMFMAARQLAIASILEQNPNAAPEDIRIGLFLRFYGDDFDEKQREAIISQLREGSR